MKCKVLLQINQYRMREEVRSGRSIGKIGSRVRGMGKRDGGGRETERKREGS